MTHTAQETKKHADFSALFRTETPRILPKFSLLISDE